MRKEGPQGANKSSRELKAFWTAGGIRQIVSTHLGEVGRDRFMQDTDLCKVQQSCHSAKHC